VEELRAMGVQSVAIGGDVSTADGTRSVFESTAAALGGIDIIVANAGIWPPQEVAVADMDNAQWSRTMRENTDAMFYIGREAAVRLPKGGRIVMVSSTAAQRGEAMHADYAASKGAMISFVKSIAVELAPRDITANCVAPGWVDTEMVAGALAIAGRERVAAGIPIGRVASPEDVAGPIVFLCSPLARHVTGEVLNVNGGSVLCG
jgi:3-oxoacyl-[acyl-carrier protein] reductase